MYFPEDLYEQFVRVGALCPDTRQVTWWDKTIFTYAQNLLIILKNTFFTQVLFFTFGSNYGSVTDESLSLFSIYTFTDSATCWTLHLEWELEWCFAWWCQPGWFYQWWPEAPRQTVPLHQLTAIRIWWTRFHHGFEGPATPTLKPPKFPASLKTMRTRKVWHSLDGDKNMIQFDKQLKSFYEQVGKTGI